MLSEYSFIVLFMVIGGLLAFVLSILSLIFVSRFSAGEEEKLEIYECGFESFEVSRMSFDVRFYLMSILFIVFDLEIMFLFPWFMLIVDHDYNMILSMLIFLFILLVGFIYEWNTGALEWE
jgi:NADH-quinone oxidoreductase subunit A